MASDILALLAQQTPSLQTRKGLVVIGLQNDLLPGGKLPVTVPPDYFDRLKALVLAFREFGDIIWVRSEFEASREVNLNEEGGDLVIVSPVEPVVHHDELEQDDDGDSPVPSKRPRVSLDETDHTMTVDRDEITKDIPTAAVDEGLFLTVTDAKDACCLPNSFGAQHLPRIQDLINARDLHVKSTHYSAFGSTSLLFTLRSKLITELYVCGGPTNLSVYATCMDAARHGLPITLIHDCLLARNQEIHETAVTRLRNDIEAEVMTSEQVVNGSGKPPSLPDISDYGDIEEDPHRDFQIDDFALHENSDELTLEVDTDEGEEDSLQDLSTSRPASSHVYDSLKDLRSYKSMQETARRLGSVRALDGSRSEALTNGVSHEMQYNHDNIASNATEIKPKDGSGENLAEPGLTTMSAAGNENAGSGSSGRVEIEDWLKKTKAPTKTSVSSKHPGLHALSALAGLDQRTVDSYEQMMSQAKEARKSTVQTQPLFGPGKSVESVGSSISFNLLSPDLSETIFDKLRNEITWERMFHQSGEVPRLVSCQGTISQDGSMPVYRHPSDQTLPTQSWTPNVDVVRKRAEEVIGHPLNHALIQLYRSGTDCISEHSDKTLDIVKGSYIVNVSFGAQRTMRLRTKRVAVTGVEGEISARTTHRVPMPHNSMIKMSLETNAEYLHGINADKRPTVELTDAETAFDGQRISLTFRNIGTFLDQDSKHIWGQGATGKTRGDASDVVNADAVESERLIRAFGTENQASTIQWDDVYGSGFNVFHLK